MKDILKILESAEKDLERVLEKINAINLGGLAEDISEKQKIIVQKMQVTRDTLRAKKIELLQILGRLADRILNHDSHGFPLPIRSFGPYQDKYREKKEMRLVIDKFGINFLYTQCNHSERTGFGNFVGCYEEYYFTFSIAVIQGIHKTLVETNRTFESESAELDNLHKQLAAFIPV